MSNGACPSCGCSFAECECAMIMGERESEIVRRENEVVSVGEDLCTSLDELIAYTTRIGGYMTAEDQAILWRAKAALARARRR